MCAAKIGFDTAMYEPSKIRQIIKICKIQLIILTNRIKSKKCISSNYLGYTFIVSEEISTVFPGKDAYLHATACPWVEYMDLTKGDRVLFQVELNERNQPAVMRIIQFRKDI